MLSCAHPCEIVWTEGETLPDGKNATHTLEIRNAPAGTDWSLWFCQFRTPITPEEGAPASIAYYGGTLYRVAPEAPATDGTLTLRYTARTLVNHGRAPEGFFLQKKGRKPVPVKVSYIWQPSERIPGFAWKHRETTPYDMIPRLKSVTLSEGTTDPAAVKAADPVFVEGQAPGWYRITLDGGIRIEAADGDGARYAAVTLDNLRRNAAGKAVPNAVVEDWPDLGYRGIMLDVSRSFTSKADLLKLIDILGHYKVNYLHLHFGDDEGWRVEIDGLPELTSFGAFRGIPVLNEDGTIDEKEALEPSYCGTLDRKDTRSSANGYYSRADFVEILRYAWERRIRVIPEFDTPGHSRAAIKSLPRLTEAADTSRYNTAQDYNDNVLNVALTSTYAFIDQVFESLQGMYAEAGAPLEAVHIGGDEVPDGAWTGSPACRELMEAEGMTDIHQLKEYFLNRVLDLAEGRGLKIAGWQEIAQHLTPATQERLRKNLAFVNFWTVSRGREEVGYRLANEGMNIIISSAPNCYLDLAYSPDKEERGHSWGGFVDERRTFSLQPFNLYRSVRWDDKGSIRDIASAADGKTPLTDEGRAHVKGVSGHLWTETIRNFDHVTYYLFPKALGLAERGWNAVPVWSDTVTSDDPAFTDDFDRFFSIIADHEYPYYDALGIQYHKN